MHVVLFAPSWPLSGNPNGIVTYVHWMRIELRRQGHKVSVLTGRSDVKEEGIREVRSSLRQRTRRWIDKRRGAADLDVFAWGDVLAEDILRLHRQTPIDVLEMEESFGWAGDVRRRTALPVVVKLHGPAFLSLVEEELDSDFGRLKIEREGAALREARCITSPSRGTLEETILRYDLRPVIARHVVNPLSLPLTAPIWSLDTCRRDTILFVGRFDKSKGGDRVLLAFKRLLDDKPNLKLIFVGPDNGLPGLAGGTVRFDEFAQGVFSKSERSRISYLGSQPQSAILKLRCTAAVTVVASRWESQGYTALEAMLQGCPLVSADTSGLSESIQHEVTGLLFDGDDIDDMAAKIAHILTNPDLGARLGRAARQYVMTAHDPAIVVEQTLAVYEAARTDLLHHSRNGFRCG